MATTTTATKPRKSPAQPVAAIKAITPARKVADIRVAIIADRPVLFNGSAFEVLVEAPADQHTATRALLAGDDNTV